MLTSWKVGNPPSTTALAYLEADMGSAALPASSSAVQQSEPRKAGHTGHLDLVGGERVAGEMCLVHDQDTQAGARLATFQWQHLLPALPRQ